jgi:hypothetical protein
MLHPLACAYVLVLVSFIILQPAAVSGYKSTPSRSRYLHGHVISATARSDSADKSLMLSVRSGALLVHVRVIDWAQAAAKRLIIRACHHVSST